MEGPAQRAVFAADGDLAFLHGLQQRRYVRAGAGAVDLVRQSWVKDRPLDEAKGAAAVGRMSSTSEPRMSAGIRSG